MNLLLDYGNTRLKACLQCDGLVLISEVRCADSLQIWLHDNAKSVSAVAIASVADQRRFTVLERILSAFFEPERIHRLRYSSQLLPSDYRDPQRLGIDRWLTLLPFTMDAMVIDAGTAFTLDLVIAGRHVGGYILPGLTMQRQALAQQTAAVNFPVADLGGIEIGLDTASCVGHGSLRALSALTKEVANDYLSCTGRPIAIVVTGGDAPVFLETMPAQLRPLLVFEGMAIALEQLQAKGHS